MKARKEGTNQAYSAWMGGNEMIGEGHISMVRYGL